MFKVQNALPSEQELLTAQGYPVYESTLRFVGSVTSEGAVLPLLGFKDVPNAAIRKMSGNTFNLPCSTTFLVYILAMLCPADPEQGLRAPASLTATVASDAEEEEDDDSEEDVS